MCPAKQALKALNRGLEMLKGQFWELDTARYHTKSMAKAIMVLN